MPSGAPSARVNRVGTADPERQSGSKMASAGMMQCCARRHALLKVKDLGAVSLRALKVDSLPALSSPSGLVIALMRPQRPATASRSGTASSPASCSTGLRTNTP
ncbi:hypothetical protein D3C71_1861840 [compost metagenome]